MGDASPLMTSSNAPRVSSFESESPAASFRIATCSAVPVLADTQRLDQAFGQARMRGDEGDHETQQTYALHVFVDEHSLHHAIREIDDPHQLIVVHEREADERPAREILVLQQGMVLGLGDILYEDRLAIRGDLSGNAMTNSDARTLGDVGSNSLRRGDV